jgi:glycosyltransferase involved in cell wall biosynthesis
MSSRILHLITTPEVDGAQTQLAQLARFLDGERHGIQIAHFYKRGNAFSDAAVPVHDLSLGGRLDPFVLYRLLRLIRGERIDLIHTHLVHAGILGKLAARLAGSIPIVTTRHYASEGKEGSIPYRLEDRMTARCAAVVAVSDAVRRHLIERRIASAEKVTVVPNGVDIDLFDSSRFAPLERGDAHDPVIGSVGRLHPQKGHSVLLDAAPAILARCPKARIEIVGEGPLRRTLESRARELGIDEHLCFLGPVPFAEIPATLARWDLFVMPSRWEGFGIAAAEAMAMGIPVVASAVEGIAELVRDGMTGSLVQPGDSGALASATLKLLADEEMRTRMGQSGRKRVAEDFSIQSAAERLGEIYGRVLR